MASIFESCDLAPPDPILGTATAYKADPSPNKVNLGIGAYRDEEGNPKVLDVVRKVDQQLAADMKVDKEYAPIDGFPALKPLSQRLLFGESSDRIASSQALSGTGALRIIGDFCAKHLNKPAIYISDPTWGNHLKVFGAAGSGLETRRYPYWDAEKRCLDFKGCMDCLSEAPAGSLVLLHAVAHNPTGMDFTHEEWQEIQKLLQERHLIPLLDCAYQGYASGDLDRDAYALRLFYQSGMEFFVAQSFAKNFGLYGERAGMCHFVTKSSDLAARALSQLKLIIRPMYSSPPIHGGLIVKTILENPAYEKEWRAELTAISGRIGQMRILLSDGLTAKGTPGTWEHIKKQIGMFSFTGLTVPQCERMINKHHIYMLKNGRISMAGLNKHNIQYVIDAMDECVRNA
ncbi:hypothetical protein FOZ61_000835 [Perkinsus olseni]|uniref:Aspartate aminotransferase n=1 Tax=Perkinsus olseni TaxID=32597 RepID=A0A7J6KSS2_PEROL|nr:hypothetical protein FOZ61_000835 [Perkinsus olseni]